MGKIKRVVQKVAPLLIILIGIGILCYPFIAQYLYQHQKDTEIKTYDAKVEQMDEDQIKKYFEEARKYNIYLSTHVFTLTDPFVGGIESADVENYNDILNVEENGVMGYVDIPCIDVYLPIYHGVSDLVLESGVGHMEASSFPIGGKSTHAVIPGHTGLSSAKMFTDLAEMNMDDLFYVHVLNKTFAYKVIDIRVVKPEDTEYLNIKKGKDLVTLVTCTPYGVNDHRLYVTGTRVPYSQKTHDSQEKKSIATDNEMKAYIKAFVIGLIVAVILILLATIYSKLKQRKQKKLVGDKKEEPRIPPSAINR